MTQFNLQGLPQIASEKINPFFEEIVDNHQEKIHSLIVTGSALTEDFDSKESDVNSIIVLNKMDFRFLEDIAPLGPKYGKKRVAAPLIMTPEHISSSLDVFPIEFFNFKLIHRTAFGDELLNSIEIKPQDLRHQCEWEIKTKLIGLRQGFLAAQADRKLLTETFGRLLRNDIPLFRALVFLLTNNTYINRNDVIDTLSGQRDIDFSVFLQVKQIKQNTLKPSVHEFSQIYEDYYAVLEKLGNIVDEITI